MAEGVLGEMQVTERHLLIGVLKTRNLDPWEQSEIQDLKGMLKEQGYRVEIENLIGENYISLLNTTKKYNFFLSYDEIDDAYLANQENTIIQINLLEKEYKKYPWLMGMYNNNINNIYIKSTQYKESKKIIKTYKGSSKVYNYSIKKTKISYKHTRVCLIKRIICSSDRGIIFLQNEDNKPNNKFSFIEFYLRYIYCVIKKILYGLFYEKKWNIFIKENSEFDILSEKIVELKKCRIPNISSEYRFYGDPFFNGNDIILEALSKKNKIGEIITIDGVDGSYMNRLNLVKKHFSYPQCIDYQGKKYCFPEMAEHSSPVIFEINKNNKIIQEVKMAGLEQIRLIDATYFYWEGVHYIFGGPKGYESECLNLYYSDYFFGNYKSHPSNPIVMNPDNARMGGAIFENNGKIFRVGQYNRGNYGEKIKIMEIVSINKDEYEENERNEIVICKGKGPHTLNFSTTNIVGDFYVDKFTIMAGINRLLACIKT